MQTEDVIRSSGGRQSARWRRKLGLTCDPELRSLASGSAVCRLRLAVNDRAKDRASDAWAARTNYVDVTVFGSQGGCCAWYLAKGRQVAIDGRLRWCSWETQDASSAHPCCRDTSLGRYWTRIDPETDASEGQRTLLCTPADPAREPASVVFCRFRSAGRSVATIGAEQR